VTGHIAMPSSTDRPGSLPLVGQGVAPDAAGQRVGAGGADLSSLVWRGLLLTILTLGLYRFWYRTDLRRWYWRNTSVGGDGFEYRGTPRELLIGFLVALAVVLPLYFAGGIAALLIASESLSSIVTFAGLAVLAVLAQYGAYRSRRFRLSRTVWRGLRFNQTGSAWRYAAMSLLWAVATVATAGLTLPLLRRALEAMKVENTSFGSAQGRFSTPAGALMLRWLPIWLPLAIWLAAAAAGFVSAAFAEDESEEQAMAAGAGVLSLLGLVVTFCLFWPIYRAAEFRLFTGGSAMGPVSFSSDLRATALFGIYIRFGLVVIGLIVVAGIIAVILIGAALLKLRLNAAETPGLAVIALAALLYLGGVYVLMALKELMLDQAFWRRAGGSISVFGLETIGGVTAAPVADETATGEGIGDALDFGGV
jgi:uncharacterized membrane protein YjgN (DUF898 family)